MICSLCHSPFPVNPPDHCGGTGYAILPDESRICYACADKHQVEQLKDRSRPFTAYVSPDASKIVTWTGGELMSVTQAWKIKSMAGKLRSYVHGEFMLAIRATDCHGGRWYGRGSPDIAISMRPCK